MIIKNYKIEKKICETRGSIIYKTDQNTTIKIEKSGFTYLENEIKIRKYLEKTNGILKILDFGSFKTNRFIVYNYVQECLFKKTMELPQIYNLANQMLDIIENIHNKGIVHCDISVCNIQYDRDNNIFYLNDFGQARHYTFAINEQKNRPLLGSPMFCSENIHNKYDYSPRDDLISLTYVLISMTIGKLPWYGNKEIKIIHEEKINFREKMWRYNIPEELKIFANYCFNLEINEKPNYTVVKKLFVNDKQLTIPT